MPYRLEAKAGYAAFVSSVLLVYDLSVNYLRDSSVMQSSIYLGRSTSFLTLYECMTLRLVIYLLLFGLIL